MDRYRHIAVEKASYIEGNNYNLDLTRFTLNPLSFHLGTECAPSWNGIRYRFQGRAHDFATELDVSIERFKNTDDADERGEIAQTLIAMHAEGLLLWPVAAMMDCSTAGITGSKALISAILKTYPALTGIRTSFDAADDVNYAKASKRHKGTLILGMWKYVVGLHFASDARIERAADFRGHHFQIVVDLVKGNAVYDSRVSQSMKPPIRALADFYRRDPTNFAAEAIRERAHRRSIKWKASPQSPPHLHWLSMEWERWLNGLALMKSEIHERALSLLTEFLSTLPEDSISTPGAAFRRKNMKMLMTYVDDWSTATTRHATLSRIRDFSVWLSNESRDANDDARFHTELFVEDLKRLKAKWGTSLGKASTDMTRPMPLKFHAMLKEIIAGNDFEWPKSLRDRRSGRLTQYFPWHGPDNQLRQVFCPVLSYLLLLLLELPIRGVQARRLDSGEGDERRWNAESYKWVTSTGRHAGYWRRAGARNIKRGVIHEIETHDGSTITGLWINSNKTQDRGTLSDETSGYKIPWENEEVLTNLDALRTWQEIYNPVDCPLPHNKLNAGTFADDPTEVISPHLPDRFYLFRYPNNTWQGGNEEPPTHSQLTIFFWSALDELQGRWNEEHPEDPIEIITQRFPSGAPRRARFTIHGMRSATLTGLHQAGVPIGIISKLVAGHASILMTLRYMNYEPQHVSELIHAARTAMDAKKQSEFQSFLKRAAFEDALRMTARVGPDLPTSRDGKFDLSVCSRMDIGICPNGGTMCRQGAIGPKDTEIEVPGGARNCVRCRFLITGYPFLIPLWVHSNALLAKADGFARQGNEHGEELVRLKAEKVALRRDRQPVPTGLNVRINAVDEAFKTAGELRDRSLADFHVALELIDKVRALGKLDEADPNDPNLPALQHDEVPTILGRPSSRYEVTDAVVQASRFYPSQESPDVERERDAMTDRIVYNGGYIPPTLAILDRVERRKAADALAKLFLTELGAVEADKLIDGSKTMNDHRGLEQTFRRVCLETTGKDVPRIGQPRMPVLLDATAVEV